MSGNFLENFDNINHKGAVDDKKKKTVDEFINARDKQLWGIDTENTQEAYELTLEKRKAEYEAAKAANTDGSMSYAVGELKKQLDEFEGKNPYLYPVASEGSTTDTKIGGDVGDMNSTVI